MKIWPISSSDWIETIGFRDLRNEIIHRLRGEWSGCHGNFGRIRLTHGRPKVTTMKRHRKGLYTVQVAQTHTNTPAYLFRQTAFKVL